MSPVLPHGRITGNYGMAAPGGGALTGLIIFRPEVKRLLINQGDADAATFIPTPVTAVLDAGGNLINPDEPGIKGVSLLANRDVPGMNPGSWLWRAHVILKRGGRTVWQTSFPVPVHAGVTTDLADLTPVGTVDGDIVRGAKGEQGDRGEDGYQGVDGDPGPAPRIRIGSVTKGADAVVTITGESPDLQLDFIVPEGGGSFATIPEQFERFGKTRVQFDGKAPTLDGYRCLNGYNPAPGDRVAMVTVDSELIIAGRVGGIVNTPPPFTVVPVDPVDPWKNADPYRYGDIRACKTSQDWIVVTGVVIAPSGTKTGDAILQLPGTHRPRVREFYVLTTVNQVSGKPASTVSVYVEEDGRVTLASTVTAGTWVSLSGITFTNQTAGRTAVGYELSYGKDAYGLVDLSGSTGNTSNATITVPVSHRPVKSGTEVTSIERLNAAGNSEAFAWAHNSAGTMLVLKNSFVSPTRYYAADNGLIWNSVTLQNGYGHSLTYDGTLQYAVRPDGLVSLRGYVLGGLSDSIVAVLPEGVRPPYEIHGGYGSGNTYTNTANRYTITPGGSILGPTVTSGTAYLAFTSPLYFPSH